MTTSGPEVVSGVTFFATLLRLSRREQPPRWTWAAAGASGFLLAVTRQLGPFWILMQLALFVGLIGLKPAWRRFGSRRWWAVGSAVAVVVGCGLNAYWQIRYEPHPSLSLDKLSEYYDPSWGDMREMGRHSIGVFGPLDTVLNPGIYFGWMAVLVVLGTLAFLVGTGRHRLILCGAITLSVCSTVALQTVQASVGFGVQGRQLLPIFITMPLLSGEVIYRNRQRLTHLRPRLLLWVSLTISILQGTAWYGVGRRYAMGPREAGLFATDPLFAPPLGWPFWGVAVFAACLMTALFGLTARPGWDDSKVVGEG